jgi:hypothetical protein
MRTLYNERTIWPAWSALPSFLDMEMLILMFGPFR